MKLLESAPIQQPLNIIKFIGSRLLGGAWGDTAEAMEVPVRANLIHYGGLEEASDAE